MKYVLCKNNNLDGIYLRIVKTVFHQLLKKKKMKKIFTVFTVLCVFMATINLKAQDCAKLITISKLDNTIHTANVPLGIVHKKQRMSQWFYEGEVGMLAKELYEASAGLDNYSLEFSNINKDLFGTITSTNMKGINQGDYVIFVNSDNERKFFRFDTVNKYIQVNKKVGKMTRTEIVGKTNTLQFDLASIKWMATNNLAGLYIIDDKKNQIQKITLLPKQIQKIKGIVTCLLNSIDSSNFYDFKSSEIKQDKISLLYENTIIIDSAITQRKVSVLSKVTQKEKTLSLKGIYDIETYHATHEYGEIEGLSDAQILMTTKESGTFVIPISDIKSIKKRWFKNTRWLNPFALMGAIAIFKVFLLPEKIKYEGKKGAEDWLAGQVFFAAIYTPPLYIGTRKTTYDTINKWTLKTEK